MTKGSHRRILCRQTHCQGEPFVVSYFPQAAAEILCEKLVPIVGRLVIESAKSNGDIGAVEVQVGKALKQIVPMLVSSGLEACSEQSREALSCPDCGLRLTTWQKRTRAVMTSYGEGSLPVLRMRCKRCRKDHYPLQVQNGLEDTHFTIGARKLIAEEASYSPYARAAERLEQVGISVSPSEVDRIVAEVSQWRKLEEDVVRTHLCQKSIDLPLPLHNWNLWQMCPEDVPCVMSVDGAKVRSDQVGPKGLDWFEVRAGVISLDGHEEHKVCVGGFMEPDVVFESLKAQWRQSPHRNRRLIFVADGALWIWDRVRFNFPEAIQVLDIYHGAEHVASAARACWGPQSDTAIHWVNNAIPLLLRADGIQLIIRDLIKVMRSAAQANATEVTDIAELHTELRYLWRNRHRMNYSKLRDQRLPIGSGIMESTIKQLSTQRLRMPGMMWTRRGADQVLRLKAAVLSKSLELTVDRQRRICANRTEKFRTKTQEIKRAV